MCGFVAAFTRERVRESEIRRAMDQLRRRGPDGEGIWRSDDAILGHRRLAVLDLDERSDQPMRSPCGRYIAVYNGEIYNYRALRQGLEQRGVMFQTNSDTEVILALFSVEGEKMLPRLHGMFALVIWDCVSKRAFVARDPYGIKPLFLGCAPSGVVIASQIKAILATGLVAREPDPQGQSEFWLLGSVPEPNTWYRDIKALPSGHRCWIENGMMTNLECWFDIGEIWQNSSELSSTSEDIADFVSSALRESVVRHLVSDVPVGVFLSGGIDSGALAGLMAQSSTNTIEGVTIAYDEFVGSVHDEAPIAEKIAAHYGIQHHIRKVTKEEFEADLPLIVDAMDQPSIDGINTWYASKAVAERGLKVVVSGVGGDELFQGYDSFESLPRLVKNWRTFRAIPGMQSAGKLAGKVQAWRSGNSRWRHASEWAKTIGGAWWLRRSLFAPDDLPSLMGAELAAEAMQGLCVGDLVLRMSGDLPGDDRLALGQIESTTYLRNQLLRDSDWASMDHSVELRTPLVDAHLLSSLQEYLPLFHRYPKKQLLAEAPDKPLPEDVTKRRKTGFGIPVANWIAGASGAGNKRLGSRDWAKKVVANYESI